MLGCGDTPVNVVKLVKFLKMSLGLKHFVLEGVM